MKKKFEEPKCFDNFEFECLKKNASIGQIIVDYLDEIFEEEIGTIKMDFKNLI